MSAVLPVARRGFTLVEVLVALCIVALGLGGAATLQLRAARAASEAAYLAGGVRLAAALAGRMQANRTAPAYQAFDYDADAGPPARDGGCYGNASCAPDALARADLRETALALAAGFPHGRIVACRDGGAADGHAAQAASALPAWACDGDADAPVVIKLGWSTDGRPAAPTVLLPVGVP